MHAAPQETSGEDDLPNSTHVVPIIHSTQWQENDFEMRKHAGLAVLQSTVAIQEISSERDLTANRNGPETVCRITISEDGARVKPMQGTHSAVAGERRRDVRRQWIVAGNGSRSKTIVSGLVAFGFKGLGFRV